MLASVAPLGRRKSPGLLLLAVLSLATLACKPSPINPLQATAAPSASSIPRFGLFELSLRAPASGIDPFLDVTLDGVFTGPDGSRIAVPGFYHGAGRWMIRFRPHTAGQWTYAWTFAPRTGAPTRGAGGFACTLPAEGHGRIRRDPASPYRWMFEDGSPWFPRGLQEGISLAHPVFSIDGERRQDTPRAVGIDEYFALYGLAGFNLFRFSQRNATYSLFDDLDHYREAESLFTDGLLAAARRHGFRVMFGFFGYYGQWAEGDGRWQRAVNRLRRLDFLRPEALDRPGDAATMAKEERFVRYAVARWGAYADLWELLNERRAAPAWIARIAAYTHSIDPDRKPLSTSWEEPSLAAIDVNAPHWYESEPESASDLRVNEMAARWKAFGKPVLVGEQGNSGMNWDAGSAVRMRVRLWTALFNQIGLIFWNTGWSKAGMHGGRPSPGSASNIYLGPQERGYAGVLAEFSSRLDAAMEMTRLTVSSPGVRAYGLRSPTLAAGYLHRFETHDTPAAGVRVSMDLPPGPLVAWWIDPATGRTLACVPAPAGPALLEAPPFRVDAAVLVNSRAYSGCQP
jgi:hypothetical protein